MKWLDKLLGVKTFIVNAEFEGFKILTYVKAKTKDEAIMEILNLGLSNDKRFIKASAWEATEE